MLNCGAQTRSGHLGEDTVEHTAYHLPIIIEDFLRKSFPSGRSKPLEPCAVAEVLRRAILSFDDAIANDVLKLFPGGLAGLAGCSNEYISGVINDGGENWQKTRLCMYGTTALVSLVCPDHDHLWVANLGDCQGGELHGIAAAAEWEADTSPIVFVSSDAGGRSTVEVLTTVHNGENRREIERVRSEHPGEAEAVADGRVLGVIAPFRCRSPHSFTYDSTRKLTSACRYR